jgi:hypothetical protein
MVELRGDSTPGKLTGVFWLLPLSRSEAVANVLLHVGAAVERRDEAEEAKRYLTAGVAEFPGIVERIHRIRKHTGEWHAASLASTHQLRCDGRRAEDKA